MKMKSAHRWAFVPRFRKSAFGWRSSRLAVTRIKQAVSEIRKTARTDPVLGAEGAVLFLEKISPALMHVDSSSGALGIAVYNAIEALVPIIADPRADDARRNAWLERLWEAVEDDDIPYLEHVGDVWGDLCATPECASRWADEFLPLTRMVWRPDRKPGEFYKGTCACLSALFKAGRYKEILELLELEPHKMWCYQEWGMKVMIAMEKSAEALKYAESSRGVNEDPVATAAACESILLSSGQVEDAYQRYAFDANRKATYLGTFRAIVRKYPHKNDKEILRDLVNSTPGQEGKWFCAATSAGLYNEAIALANQSPCDPKTLIRAARDMESKDPVFAREAGLAALRWLVEGYGYEITSLDVRAAYSHTMNASRLGACPSKVPMGLPGCFQFWQDSVV